MPKILNFWYDACADLSSLRVHVRGSRGQKQAMLAWSSSRPNLRGSVTVDRTAPVQMTMQSGMLVLQYGIDTFCIPLCISYITGTLMTYLRLCSPKSVLHV